MKSRRNNDSFSEEFFNSIKGLSIHVKLFFAMLTLGIISTLFSSRFITGIFNAVIGFMAFYLIVSLTVNRPEYFNKRQMNKKNKKDRNERRKNSYYHIAFLEKEEKEQK